MSYDKLKYRARLILTIGTHLGVPEQIEVPIHSVRANHSENSIPTCVVGAATGRLAQATWDVLKASILHRKYNQLALPSRALVQLQVTRQASSRTMTQEWPTDWFTAFDGWVSQVSPSMTLGDRSVTIQLTHWLSDLDFSSPYSEDAYPTTPADFLFNAATVAGTGLGKRVVGSTYLYKALNSFTSASIASDFWDDGNDAGLRPFLQGIAGERLFNWREVAGYADNPTAEGVTPTNNLMLGALDRFEPFFDEEFLTNLYTYGSRLALRTDLQGFNEIANRIKAQVCAAAYTPQYIGSTMWDRLSSGLTGQYMFSIIPMVDRALTVPYTPWLSSSRTTLFASDVDVLQYTLQVRRPIRAVAVIGTYGSYTGLNSARQPGGAESSVRRALGYFQPEFTAANGIKDGMIMPVEAPMWINDLLMHGVSSFTAPRSAKFATAQNPGGRPDNFVGPPDPNNPETLDAVLENKTVSGEALANALAKATYLQEATKWRQMVVSTNLRFDLAPGSSVVFQVSPDSALERVLAPLNVTGGESVIGRVVSVSWTLEINGTSGVASTVYHLAYLRSLIENEDSAFSADDHPLWRDVWTGAPLVGLEEFQP